MTNIAFTQQRASAAIQAIPGCQRQLLPGFMFGEALPGALSAKVAGSGLWRRRGRAGRRAAALGLSCSLWALVLGL